MASKTIWLRQKSHTLFSFSFFPSPSTIFDITHYILRFLVVQYSIFFRKFQEKKFTEFILVQWLFGEDWRSKFKPEIPEMTSGITWQNWAARRAVASATNKNQQDQ